MENYELGNGVLSDHQLDKWSYKNIPGYRGTINRSQFRNLYEHMGPGDSTIINLDPHYKHGGTHWVALRISNSAPLVYYKDSFGAPPPKDISEVINIHGRHGLIYGNRINQKLKEENCGKRSAEFLRNMYIASKKNKEIEFFEQHEG